MGCYREIIAALKLRMTDEKRWHLSTAISKPGIYRYLMRPPAAIRGSIGAVRTSPGRSMGAPDLKQVELLLWIEAFRP